MQPQFKIKQVWGLLTSSEAIRQSVILSAGTTLTGIIMAAAMIVASKMLGPEKFGMFSVSVTLAFVISKVMDMGMHQVIPKLFNQWHGNTTQQYVFLRQILYWKVILTVLTVVMGVVVTPFVTRILNYPHPELVYWAVFGSVAISWYEYVYVLLSGKQLFTQLSLLSIAQGVIKAVGMIGLFLLNLGGVFSVTIAYYVAPVIAVMGFIPLLRKESPLRPALADVKTRATIYSFLRHMFIGVIMMTLISNLDLLMVQKYLSAMDTGIYAGATRIASLVGLVTASIGGVLINRVSRYKDKEILRLYLLKSVSIILLAVLGFVVFLPFARLSLEVTIGSEYLSGLQTLILLVGNAFFSLAIVPYSSFFYGVNHPRYFSVSGILQVVTIFVGNYLLLPSYGIYGAAIVKTIANVVFFFFTLGYIVIAMRSLRTK